MHWEAILELTVGTVLSMLIGAEREFYAKPAGIRTCALVGLGSTLFTLVSRHGAWMIAGVSQTDGSRLAAQIVSGIGFLGAGLIFVHQESVRGLTTAACIWIVAAIGVAAGAGTLQLALEATALYFLVVLGLRPFQNRFPKSRHTHNTVHVTYEDGHGVLRNVLETLGDNGVAIEQASVENSLDDPTGRKLQTVALEVSTHGGSISECMTALSQIKLVHKVSSKGLEPGEE